jgi:hypothetical protein
MKEWRYSSTFLDLGTRLRWMVSFRTLTLWIGSRVEPRVGLDAVEKRRPCTVGIWENIMMMIIQFNSIQFIYVQNLTATGQLQS